MKALQQKILLTSMIYPNFINALLFLINSPPIFPLLVPLFVAPFLHFILQVFILLRRFYGIGFQGFLIEIFLQETLPSLEKPLLNQQLSFGYRRQRNIEQIILNNLGKSLILNYKVKRICIIVYHRLLYTTWRCNKQLMVVSSQATEGKKFQLHFYSQVQNLKNSLTCDSFCLIVLHLQIFKTPRTKNLFFKLQV